MPRQARIDIPGLLQHVIVRGIEQSPIFYDDQDREDFLRRLRGLLSETETDCYAWTLLDNHVHLLLRTQERPLAEVMRRLLTGYAVVFNRRHKRVGHLFQNRYKSIVCDQDAYLLELIRYIHLNPVRAGKISTLAALANDPWCGHAELLGASSRTIISVDQILTLFSRTSRGAQAKYLDFIADGLHLSSGNDYESGSQVVTANLNAHRTREGQLDERTFWEEGFAAQLRNNGRCIAARGPGSLDALLLQVAGHFGLSPEELADRSKERRLVAAKAVLCYVAVRRKGLKGVAVAARLNYTSAAVSHAIKRGQRLFAANQELQRLLTQVEEV